MAAFYGSYQVTRPALVSGLGKPTPVLMGRGNLEIIFAGNLPQKPQWEVSLCHTSLPACLLSGLKFKIKETQSFLRRGQGLNKEKRDNERKRNGTEKQF